MGKVISLSSTHGSGKTTCAYSLASKLKKKGFNIAVLNELARECPFNINQEATIKTQYWLLCNQIIKELELCAKYDYVVSDRGVVDPVAYANAIFFDNYSFENQWIGIVRQHIKDNYVTSIILDKDEFNYQIDDGVRDLDVSFRDTVYKEILRIYKKLNVDYNVIFSEKDIYLKAMSYLR